MKAQSFQVREQMQYTEAQIKEAFQKVAGDFRYWKAEMVEIIPALVGLPITNHDSWEHWSKFEPIQKAEALKWKDRVIALAIDASAQLQAPSIEPSLEDYLSMDASEFVSAKIHTGQRYRTID